MLGGRFVTGTYRGLPAHVRREQRRQLLIEAGLDCLHEDGLVGVSVRSICTRARLTPRYFYESFADLDALLVAVIDSIADQITAAGLVAIASEPTLAGRVRAAIAAACNVVGDDRRKATAVLTAASGHAPLRERRHEHIVSFADTAVLALTDWTGPDDEIRATALFLVGGAVELIEAVLSGALPLTLERLVDQLSAMWLAALEGIGVETG
jgi:AcrR family transcriptional regulator